jgi:hypothetical protein
LAGEGFSLFTKIVSVLRLVGHHGCCVAFFFF